MLRWLVSSSLALRYLVIVLAAVLMAFGLVQLRKMPLDVYPEFNPPLVEVQTEALGLSASEVESLITTPMEADLLNGVAWLDQIYSESVAGLSRILLLFEPGTDEIAARQMVQERLTQAFALPNVSQPPNMLQPLSSSSRVLLVGLSSTQLSLIDMGVLAHWNIKPRLMGVPGVANVAIWGQRDRQLQVLVDPKQLHEKKVTLQQVIETTGEALWMSPLSYLESSSPGTAGFFDTPNQRISVRHELPIVSAAELAQIPVDDMPGVVLGDVAQVVEDHQLLIGEAQLDNSPALLMLIEKFPSANTLEVTRAVEDALENLKPGLQGIEIDTTLFRPANYLEAMLGNLRNLLLLGGGLAALLLFVLFFNWRSALISLLVVPLALVLATYVLYLRGATLNVMLLAGLLIALVAMIDDAVTITDNIARRLRKLRTLQAQAPLSEAINLATLRDAVLEVNSPTLVATLIMLLAVLPVFFIEGLTGAFFQPLVQAYVIAALVSLLVALIATPALSMVLFGNATLPAGESALVGGLQKVYRRLLASGVNKPSFAYLVLALLLIGGLALGAILPANLVPTFRQSDLFVQWTGAPGTSGVEMNRVMTQASAALREIPGVRKVGAQVGRAITGDQIVGSNSAQLWINLDPTADYDVALAAINEVVADYPGLSHTVQNYQPQRTGAALQGVSHDLAVRVYGVEFDELNAKAAEIQQAVAGISGVALAETLLQPDEPTVEIEVDLAKAEAHGIKPGDVRRASSTLLSSLQVGNLYEGQKVFEVVVWGVPEVRNNLNHIGDMLIDKPNGTQVRLGDLADVRIVPSPALIQRDTVARFVDVGVNVSGRSLAAVAADIKTSLQGISFPYEYHAEVIDQGIAQQNAWQRVLIVALTALLGIFLLLHALTGRWTLSLAVLLALLASLAGGVLAATLSSGLTLGALIGLGAVLAISARSALAMLDHFHQVERRDGKTFGAELVLWAASDRFPAIITTALALLLVILPLIFAGNIAGTELLRPLALVVLGGLITTLIVNLFVLPALYLRFGPSVVTELPELQGGAQPVMKPV